MSANKEGKKPQYKDYVNFLDTYKNGKKDETSCHSLTNSSNNSSTSINSDGLNEQPTKGFKEYLENYENRKFSSVKPTFLKKSIQPNKNKKMVKTEIFININNDNKSVNNTTKSIENSNGIKSNNNSVNKVTKIFEKNSNSETITKTVSSKVNKYNSQQSETETDGSEQKKISVEEISKKFQTNGGNNKGTLKKQNSIKEKTKLFENNTNEITTKNQSTKIQLVKQNSFKENSETFKNQKHYGTTKPSLPLPPKPPIIKIELAQKIAHNGVEDDETEKTSPPCTNGKNISNKNVIGEALSKSVTSPGCASFSPNISCTNNNIPSPPPIPSLNGNTFSGNFFIPASLSTIQTGEMHETLVNSNETSKSSSSSSIPSPPPVKTTNSGHNIPAPPPPPPSDFSNKVTSAYLTSKSNNTYANKQKVTGYSTLPRMQSSKPKDGSIDGIQVPTLDKNDPRVKRLVYGALRDMYGAYHDQANNYLATLPKNRVRKNNGLDSIISSIA